MPYRVNDLYQSIQGEGVQTGTPMTIIRLQGCEVGCSFCDTKETWHGNSHNKVDSIAQATCKDDWWCEVSAQAIWRYMEEEGYAHHVWALLTGGEPAEQRLDALVACLHRNGRKVALETSGTAIWDGAFDWVTVSPKFDGRRPLLEEAVARADELKIVVGSKRDLASLHCLIEQMGKRLDGVIVCLQPMSLSQNATALCIEACMKTGARLSVQTHRLIGLP